MSVHDFSTLFDLLPIGAYRSTADGRQLRANAALVRLNGYASEAEMLAAVTDISREFYVLPGQRQLFVELMARDGHVVDFRSQVYRHKTREPIWVCENAHLVRDSAGTPLFFEGTIEDITVAHETMQALANSERRFRALTEKAQVLTLVCDAQGHITYASAAAHNMLGHTTESMTGSQLSDWLHPQELAQCQRELTAIANGHVPDHEKLCRFRHADGSWRQLAALTNNCLEEETIRGIVLHCRDATERMRAEGAERALVENEARWKLALESAGDGVWDYDLLTGTAVFSQQFLQMHGMSAQNENTHIERMDEHVHPDDRAQRDQALQDHLTGCSPSYASEYRIRRNDGSWKWILSRGMVISRSPEGTPLRLIGTHTDITDRKNAEAQIWQQANFDPLTGLPNRRMLRDRLVQEIKKTARDGKQLAILFVDLDHFKEVNDTLGHDAGDLLLVEAARRITQCVRNSDTVARMGGDEFTVVLSDLQHEDRLDRILHDLLQAMANHFQIGQEQIYVSASIGITLYPDDGLEVETLFKNADQALYVAKGAGRNRFSFFTPALQEAAQARVRLANELRAGVASAQFQLVYQPIVSLADGQVRKAEALLRWQHPTRGAVGPCEFIPIAESSGLIIEMGEWVFRQAAAQSLQWRRQHHPQFQISINKSPVQFHNDAGHQDRWGAHLASIGLAGDGIAVEITEGLLLNTSAAVTEQLKQLHETGIQVSLDDFGTGYSSLTYLQRFDIDTIKIDQSFVRHLAPDATELALCQAIIVMAHALGMQVVAEGVETAQQLALLTAAGCDFGQGYLFARPMAAPDFDAFMETVARDPKALLRN
ncbi:MAG: EAL domain-containing protein [Burkholderiaceae bacterium]